MDVFGIHLLDRAGTLALGDVRVRRAISFAFDNEALLEATQFGYGTATDQMFPPTSIACDRELGSYYSYDPERARELLAEAGYPDGFLDMPTTPAYQTTFVLVAAWPRRHRHHSALHRPRGISPGTSVRDSPRKLDGERATGRLARDQLADRPERRLQLVRVRG